MTTQQERQRANKSEAGVQAAPWEWDMVNPSDDKGEHGASSTAQKAEVDHPSVTNWVAVRANKQQAEEYRIKST